jgi:hypothetical protein
VFDGDWLWWPRIGQEFNVKPLREEKSDGKEAYFKPQFFNRPPINYKQNCTGKVLNIADLGYKGDPEKATITGLTWKMQRGAFNRATNSRYQSYAVLIARVRLEGRPWEPYIKLWTVDEDGATTRSFTKYSGPDKDDNSPDDGSNKPFSKRWDGNNGKDSNSKGNTKGDKGNGGNNSWGDNSWGESNWVSKWKETMDTQFDSPQELSPQELFPPLPLSPLVLPLLFESFPLLPSHRLLNGLFDPSSGELSSLSGPLYFVNDRVVAPSSSTVHNFM